MPQLGADNLRFEEKIASKIHEKNAEGEDIAAAEHRRLKEDAEVTRAFEEAVLKHNRRKLRHGCANSRSGCRVLPPPRR